MNRILDAAARLFGRDGFEGATMLSVARAAGVSKGLLHYHFRSKEHLLIEAQRATFRQIHLRFEERVQRGERGLDTALEALDTLWEAVRGMRAWAPFMLETMSLATQQSTVREHLAAFYREGDTLLEKGIREVFAADTARLMLPPPRLARVIRAGLHGLVVELAHARDDDELSQVDLLYQDLKAQFARLVLDGPSPQKETV